MFCFCLFESGGKSFNNILDGGGGGGLGGIGGGITKLALDSLLLSVGASVVTSPFAGDSSLTLDLLRSSLPRGDLEFDLEPFSPDFNEDAEDGGCGLGLLSDFDDVEDSRDFNVEVGRGCGLGLLSAFDCDMLMVILLTAFGVSGSGSGEGSRSAGLGTHFRRTLVKAGTSSGGVFESLR